MPWPLRRRKTQQPPSPAATAVVTVYSRGNCHLCHEALTSLHALQQEMAFTIEEISIEGNSELEGKYGEQVPVIFINNQPHDYFRVDPERFRREFKKLI